NTGSSRARRSAISRSAASWCTSRYSGLGWVPYAAVDPSVGKMQDVKAPAGEWRIGNFLVAGDKLEAAVHGDCPALNDGRNPPGGAIQPCGGKIALCRSKSQHTRRI